MLTPLISLFARYFISALIRNVKSLLSLIPTLSSDPGAVPSQCLPQVLSEDEHSQDKGNQSPNTGSVQSSPRRVRSETMFLERAAPLLRRIRHSQSLAFEKRLAPEPKPTIERFLEA